MAFVSDSFTGTDGTSLSIYDAAWVKHAAYSGVAVISSNRARRNNLLNAMYYYNSAPSVADYSVSADIYVASLLSNDYIGLMAREASGSNSGYMARYHTPTTAGWYLYKAVNGTYTQLGSGSAQTLTVGNTYNCKLECNGTSIKIFKENETTPVISVTDSAISDAGYPGIRLSGNDSIYNSTGLQIDNFIADYISSGADLSGAAPVVVTGSGSITAELSMSSAAAAVVTVGGVVNQSLGLSGSAASITVANGIATITTEFSGDAFVQMFADGTLAQAQSLAGAAGAIVSGPGAINLATTIAGAAIIEALVNANLDSGGQNDLSGAATINAIGAGDASIALAMLADAGIQTSSSGTILCALPITGTAPVTVTSSVGLTSTQALSGAAVTVANTSGDVTIGYGGLSANAIIEALAGGSISMSLSMSVDALINAVSAASLTVVSPDSIPVGAYRMQPVNRYAMANIGPRYAMRSYRAN